MLVWPHEVSPLWMLVWPHEVSPLWMLVWMLVWPHEVSPLWMLVWPHEVGFIPVQRQRKIQEWSHCFIQLLNYMHKVEPQDLKM